MAQRVRKVYSTTYPVPSALFTMIENDYKDRNPYITVHRTSDKFYDTYITVEYDEVEFMLPGVTYD